MYISGQSKKTKTEFGEKKTETVSARIINVIRTMNRIIEKENKITSCRI